MSDHITTAAYAIFALSTVIFLRRAKYGWVAALLVALLSPLVYMVLYACVAMPLGLLLGLLGISGRVISQEVLYLVETIVVLAAWCFFGYRLTRSPAGQSKVIPPRSDESTKTG